MSKLLDIFPLGTVAGLVWALFQKYIFNDWEFLGFLFVLSVMDTLLGMYYAWQKNELSSKGYRRIFTKMIVYSCLIILGHVLTGVNITGIGRIVLDTVKYGIYCSLVFNEALSILTNCGKLGFGVPKWILQRLSDFNEKGEMIAPIKNNETK